MSESTCKICQLSFAASELALQTELWRIRHSQETNILGYFLLEPKRHFLDLSEATEAELAQYATLLSLIMKAQREILHCQRVYTFSLAEAVPHFHVHVIPRAKEFVRAYRGRGIMSYPTVPAANSSLVEQTTQLFAAYFRRSSAAVLSLGLLK